MLRIIELDGGQHAEQLGYDLERDTRLRAQGFLILRFWNSEVLQNVCGLKDEILSKLESIPFLNPSPQGGRKKDSDEVA